MRCARSPRQLVDVTRGSRGTQRTIGAVRQSVDRAVMLRYTPLPRQRRTTGSRLSAAAVGIVEGVEGTAGFQHGSDGIARLVTQQLFLVLIQRRIKLHILNATRRFRLRDHAMRQLPVPDCFATERHAFHLLLRITVSCRRVMLKAIGVVVLIYGTAYTTDVTRLDARPADAFRWKYDFVTEIAHDGHGVREDASERL